MGNEEVGCSDVGGFEDPLNSVMVFGVNEAVVRDEREDEPSYEEDEGDKQDRVGEEKRDIAMAVKGSSKGHSPLSRVTTRSQLAKVEDAPLK
nr:hypothetical protein Itr_chr10CG16830 [Ipomoea trifida]